MRELMLVAAGGSLGAVARYATGLAAARWLGKGFPWGTLAVNVIGCFLMGMVLKLLLNLESHSAEAITPALRGQIVFWRQGVAIGFLGALTTFSSFGADTIRQLEAGHLAAGIANIAANVLVSLGAVWCGLALIETLD